MKNFLKVFVCLSLLSSCTSTPTEQLISDAIVTAITGTKTSHGNKAQCNQYKMTCDSYREWTKDNKIACSCKNN
jgi:hypothetical protein